MGAQREVRTLGIPRNTLYRKLERYGLSKEQ
jgi:transcriptional regulator of acetoin/glycerol metabolism